MKTQTFEDLSPLWPLTEISRPPKPVYYRGCSNVWTLPRIALIGSRRPSSYSKRAAYCLGRSLANSGFCVVSGLATGIDRCAHEAAMAAGGMTVAVLGHGLNHCYPRAHWELRERIEKQGGCLSEYEDSTPALPWRFAERNRLIAGLCQVVIVVEAGERSGSLITAQFALDEGREVWVVPGPFDEQRYAGSHRLINDGAKLLTEDFTRIETPSLTPVAAWFHEPESTFQALWERSGLEVSRVWEELERAKQNEWVVELAPHRYLWLGLSRDEGSDRSEVK